MNVCLWVNSHLFITSVIILDGKASSRAAAWELSVVLSYYFNPFAVFFQFMKVSCNISDAYKSLTRLSVESKVTVSTYWLRPMIDLYWKDKGGLYPAVYPVAFPHLLLPLDIFEMNAMVLRTLRKCTFEIKLQLLFYPETMSWLMQIIPRHFSLSLVESSWNWKVSIIML